jgi:hypothetical protein
MLGKTNVQSLNTLRNLAVCCFLLNQFGDGLKCYYRLFKDIDALKVSKVSKDYKRWYHNLNIDLGTVLVSGSKEECLLSIRILEELFPTH